MLPSVTSVKIVSSAFDTLVLLTAVIGTYSLTLIVWFLFRWRRAQQDTKVFGLDELYHQPYSFSPTFNIMFSLVPLFGPFGGMITHPSIRTIFWLAVFISLLPTTLWLYLVTAQIWIGCGAGLIGCFLISQYATFFALVLDRFFESKMLWFACILECVACYASVWHIVHSWWSPNKREVFQLTTLSYCSITGLSPTAITVAN